MYCGDRVWLTMVEIPTSRHNISVFLLLWKLSVNCKQLVLVGEVQQKVDWMWLANVLVVFEWPAVKRNTECAHDNVLLLCTHVRCSVQFQSLGNVIISLNNHTHSVPTPLHFVRWLVCPVSSKVILVSITPWNSTADIHFTALSCQSCRQSLFYANLSNSISVGGRVQ